MERALDQEVFFFENFKMARYVAKRVSRDCCIAKVISAGNANHPEEFLKVTIVESQTFKSTILINTFPIMNRWW